jgi:hypothetical protein
MITDLDFRLKMISNFKLLGDFKLKISNFKLFKIWNLKPEI